MYTDCSLNGDQSLKIFAEVEAYQNFKLKKPKTANKESEGAFWCKIPHSVELMVLQQNFKTYTARRNMQFQSMSKVALFPLSDRAGHFRRAITRWIRLFCSFLIISYTRWSAYNNGSYAKIEW